MPKNTSDRPAKRKHDANAEAPRKRTRFESSDEYDDEVQERILLLEEQIVKSKKNYNNIASLIALAREGVHDKGEIGLMASVSLCRVFIRLLASGNLVRKKSLSDSEGVIVQWLKDRLDDYKNILTGTPLRPEWAPTLLTLSMRLLKTEGQYINDKAASVFPEAFFSDIVRRVMKQSSLVDGLVEEFIQGFVDKYDDVRFYTFKAIAKILRDPEATATEGFDGAFSILSLIHGVPDSNNTLDAFYVESGKETSNAVHCVSQHKKQAQQAWLALLNLGLSEEQRKRTLLIMSAVIAPWFTKPELLMDFLTDCYDAGGSVSLLSLSGVFYLIQERNLDYPAFYSKLYSLLDESILHSKHRSRFFRHMDIFLNSSHLPAQLVASFIKRLARLCLNAPPGAIVAVVPWFYNMFKKHPSCTFMLHRVPRTQEEKDRLESEGVSDPFLPDEKEPMETRAIDSCVWEIVQLQSHYHPNVATIAKIMSEQFTKQFYNVEDFLDHTYATLLEAETSKQVKKAPVVEFQIPKRIFFKQEEDSAAADSLLVKLVDFS